MSDDNASEINPGDVVHVVTDPGFTNTAGAPTDPSTVSLVWYPLGEPPITWVYPTNVTQDETGTFSADIPVTRAVPHYYRWVGTGTVAAAAESSFEVKSKFGG